MFDRCCVTALVSLGVVGCMSTAQAAERGCPSHVSVYALSAHSGGLAVEIDLVLMSEFLNIAGFVSREGVTTDSFIRNLSIRHDGVEYDAQGLGNGAWQVTDIALGSRVQISYDLSLEHGSFTWSFGAEEVGLSAGDHYFLVSRVGLLADYGAVNCPVRIVAELDNFQTPWWRTGPNTYYAPDLDRFHNNGFAFGSELNRLSVPVGGEDVVFVSDDASLPLAHQAADEIGAMMEHLTHLFGAMPADNYHVFLYANDRPEGAAFNDSLSFLYPAPAQEVDALIWRHGIIHELAHIWIGHTIRPAQGEDLEWFREGFTDYLAIKTMFRLGLLTEHELAEKLENLMRRYVMGLFMSQGQVRLTQAGANKDENRFLIYGGGATLAFMLDLEMSSTLGPGRFDAMLVDLFNHAEEPYTAERLLARMDAASDGAASRLLMRFDGGLMPMQFTDLMEPYGVELAFMVPDMYQIDLTPGEASLVQQPPAFLQPLR